MDTIKGLNEAIEAEFGEAIVARDESLAALLDVRGLGPPDLVWLQKNAKNSSLIGMQGEAKGYYHHAIGRDVSSSAAVAAYFAELNGSIEPMSFMQGLWFSSETVIERGFYCCYDPFTRLDVRCELCVPGGVVSGALDPSGQVRDVTQELWGHCQLAGFLRSELLDPELTSQASPLHPMRRFPQDPIKPTLGSETRLLDVVYSMYSKGTLPMALEYITFDPGRGCTVEHMDLVLCTLMHYFLRRQKVEQGVDFFIRLTQVHAPAAIYVASLQRQMGRVEESLDILAKALEHAPEDPQISVALGIECLYSGQVESATKLARRAIRICGAPPPSQASSQAPPPSSRPMMQPRAAWLLLARCYIKLGLYALSIVTLNVMPPPPNMTMSEEDMIFVVPPSKPKSTTKPSVTQRVDTEESAVLQMDKDETMAEGSSDLKDLFGAAIISRESMDTYPWPDVCPYRSTRVALQGAYGVLQELVAAVGWDAFLDLRGRLFLMHDEAAYAARPPAMSAEEAQERRERRRREQLFATSMQDSDTVPPGLKGVTASSFLEHIEDDDDDDDEVEEVEVEGEDKRVGEGKGDGSKEEGERGKVVPESSVVLEVMEVAESVKPSLAPSASSPPPHPPPPPPASTYSSLWEIMFGSLPSQDPSSAEETTRISNNPESDKDDHKAAHKAGPVAESLEGQPASSSRRQDHSRPDTDVEGEGEGRDPELGLAGGRGNDEGYLDEGEEDVWGQSMSWSGQINSIAVDRWAAVTGGTTNSTLTAASRKGTAIPQASEADDEEEEDEEEEGEGGQGMSGGIMKTKRLSSRWLDELVSALWQDLQAYLDWAAEDTKLERTTGNSLSGHLLGDPSLLTPPPSSSYKGAVATSLGSLLLPRVTPGDWLRRGMLAERLYHEDQALTAFRCACLTSDAIASGSLSLSGLTVEAASKLAQSLSSPPSNPSTCFLLAWTSLMRLATSLGNVPAAIQAMHRVLSWHERKAAASPSGATATAAAETTGAGGQMKACPLSVVRCLHLLLALDGEAGLEHEGIKEKLLDLGKVHPSVAREIKASEQQGAPSPAPSYLLQASSSFSQTS